MRKSGHAHAGKPLLTPLVRALREVFKQASHWKPARHSHRPHRDSVPANSIRFEPHEPRVLLSADINPAQTITGSIDVPGETDQYRFTLPQNARIVFDSVTNNPNLNWSLSGPTGALVDSRPFSASDGTAANSVLDLTAGDYTLTVDAPADITGAYTFRLIDPLKAQEIVPGTVVSGQLDPANTTNVYRFSATTGERFYFDFKSLSGGTVNWRLLDPNGGSVFGLIPISQEGEYTANFDGSYTLVIEGAMANTGVVSYSFNAQKIVDDVKPLVPGASQGTGPQWTSGQLGGGLILDGLQYGEVASNASIDLTQSVTMEAWIKVDPFANTLMPIFYKGSGNPAERTYSLWLNSNGSVLATTGDATGDQSAQTAAGLVDLNQWQHVAAVIDRGTTPQLRIFVDGVQRATATLRTTPARSNTNPLLIGSQLETNTTFANFEGTIDEVRVWNVARTAAQIAASNSLELAGTEAGLAVYLKANEGTGSQLADAKRLYFDSLTNNSALTWSLVGPRGTVISNRTFTSSDSFDVGLGAPILDLVAGSYTLTIDVPADSTVPYAFRLLDLAQAPLIAPGTTVSGQLSPAKETDLYRFTASAGERFFFDFVSASGGETYWRVLDPFGQVVFDRSPFSADLGLKTLENTGTYTVVIEGRITTVGNASYTFNAQRIVDDVKPLALGVSQGTDHQWTAGQLGGAVYLDGLQYGEVANSATVNQNRAVTLEAWINADRIPGAATPIFYKGNGILGQRTYTVWLNANGSLTLSTADGAEQSITTAAGVISPHQWQHVAAVMDRASAVMKIYVDGVERATGTVRTTNASSNTNPLFIGHSLEGNVNFEGAIDDVREWSVARTAAQIAAAKDTELSGTQTGLVLYLKANEGTGGSLVDTSGQGNNALINPPYSTTSGVVAGRIDHPGQRDFYTFTLAGTTRLYFDSLTDNSALTWSLIGPRGTVSRTFSNADSTDFGDGAPVYDLVGGDYTLVVSGSADLVAPYAFRLLDVAQATAVTPGATISGQLSPAKETDLYSLAVNSGDQFFFDSLSATGGETYWRLLDPYGEVVFDRTAMTAADPGLKSLNYTGTYLLLIEGRVNTSGTASYSFKADRTGNVPVTLASGAAYTVGSLQSGILATAAQQDTYRFTLTTDTRVYFDALTSNASLKWSITGARTPLAAPRSFTASDAIDGTSIFDFVAGDYALTVTGAAVGYSFRLVDLAGATEIVPSAPVTGTLSPANETDAYRFNAAAGDRFFFDFQSASNSLTYWRLLDPFGRAVFGPRLMTAASGDVDTTTLAFTGTYTLLVEGQIGAGTGTSSYSFLAQRISDDVKPLVFGQAQGIDGRQWTSGQLGGAAYLDGAMYGEVANNATIDVTRTLTLEAWVKVDRFADSGVTPIVYKGNGAATQRTYALWVNGADGSVVYSTSDNFGGTNIQEVTLATAGGVIAADEWHHVAVVQDRNGNPNSTVQLIQIYVDGVLQANSAGGPQNLRIDVNANSTSNPLLIGRDLEGHGNFEGTVDDIRLWNVARTAAQIQASMGAELLGSESGLVLYLKANEGTGTLLGDASNHGNNAQLRNVYTAGSAVVAGRIDQPGQRDFYTFTLAQAKLLYFDSLTQNASLTWTLSGPRGTVVNARSFTASDSFEFGAGSPVLDLVAGDYTLMIDAPADQTSPYAFHLFDLSQVTAYTPGTVTEAVLSPSRENDVYRFDATAGDRFYFDAQRVTGGADIYWRLVNPFGKLVFDRTSFANDVGILTLELTGSYVLLIEGRVGATDTTTYRSNAQRISDDVTPLVFGQAQGIDGRQWTRGQLGGAAYLDGAMYGEVANNATIDVTRTLTLEAWVKVDRFADSGVTPIVYKGNGAATQRTYALWVNGADGSVVYSTSDNFGGTNIQEVTLATAGGVIAADEWHHVAVVQDRNGNPNSTVQLIQIYVDGVLQANSAGGPQNLRIDVNANSTSNPLLIG